MTGTGEEAPAGALESALLRARLPLVAALRRRGLSAADAEDAAQEAVLKALERPDRYRAGRPVLPWLVVVAWHAHLDHLRRRPGGAVSPLRVVPAPTEEAVQAEERTRVGRALGRLPRKLRRVVELFYMQELTITEVAARLGLPEGTVKSHLHRARKRLARMLSHGT